MKLNGLRERGTAGNDSRYQIPILQKTLTIIEQLAQSSDGLTLVDIVELTDVTKSSAFRILETLCENRYLYRDDETRKFRLTGKLLEVGYKATGQLNLIEKSLMVMRELRDQTKETVLIGSIIGCNFVVLEQVLGLHPFKFMAEVGMQTTIHSNAPGKAILAFLPSDIRSEMLKNMKLTKYTSNTITEKDKLVEHIETVRKQGYATDNAEEIEGVYCVAAPVFDRTGYPVAAIWITGPSSRFAMKHLMQLGPIVREYADRISSKMGYAF